MNTLASLKIRKAGVPSVARWNRMIDFLQMAMITSFIGGTFARSKVGTILAVKSGGGGGVESGSHPWQPYASPYEGGGDPPEDQAFRIRVRRGRINGVLPGNIGDEFSVPPASAYRTFWAKYELVHDAGETTVSSVTIEQGDVLPESNTGFEPATRYESLFGVTTDANGITFLSPELKANLTGGMVVSDYTCSEVARSWMWGNPSLPD